jgi:hypothetical protein
VVVELDDVGELGGADGIWSEAGPASGGGGGVDRSRKEGQTRRKWAGGGASAGKPDGDAGGGWAA